MRTVPVKVTSHKLNINRGDIVVFGDIRWYVIAKTETGYTLLCEKPVINMPFNEAGYQTTGTWDNSTSRAWLNGKFYNTFTEDEKELMTKFICSHIPKR